MLPWQPFLAFYIWGAHWHHLKNTTEPSMSGGDVAFVKLLSPLVYYYVLVSSVGVYLQETGVELGANGWHLGLGEGEVLSSSHDLRLRVRRQRSDCVFPNADDLSVRLAVQQDALSQDRCQSRLHSLVS